MPGKRGPMHQTFRLYLNLRFKEGQKQMELQEMNDVAAGVVAADKGIYPIELNLKDICNFSSR